MSPCNGLFLPFAASSCRTQLTRVHVLYEQVFREGNNWYHTGWEQGADLPGLMKRKVIAHMEDSDPNLPPSGQGWVRCGDGSPSTISFSISPNFEKEMVYRLGGSSSLALLTFLSSMPVLMLRLPSLFHGCLMIAR